MRAWLAVLAAALLVGATLVAVLLPWYCGGPLDGAAAFRWRQGAAAAPNSTASAEASPAGGSGRSPERSGPEPPPEQPRRAPTLVYFDLGGNTGTSVTSFMDGTGPTWKYARPFLSGGFAKGKKVAPANWAQRGLPEVAVYVWEPLPRYRPNYAAIVKKFPMVTYFEGVAWLEDGNVTFYPDQVSTIQDGSSLTLKHPRTRAHKNLTVSSTNFQRFFETTVGAGDFVLVKMDIEGAEYDLLPRLLVTGVACQIDVLAVEFHAPMDPIRPAEMTQLSVAEEEMRREYLLCPGPKNHSYFQHFVVA